jgi:hypothetical protein
MKRNMIQRKEGGPALNMTYFFELFSDLPRQGPGCREAILRALGVLKDLPSTPKVLDIGCGSGMQTLIIARKLKTTILAIDNYRPVAGSTGSRSGTAGTGYPDAPTLHDGDAVLGREFRPALGGRLHFHHRSCTRAEGVQGFPQVRWISSFHGVVLVRERASGGGHGLLR